MLKFTYKWISKNKFVTALHTCIGKMISTPTKINQFAGNSLLKNTQLKVPRKTDIKDKIYKHTIEDLFFKYW